MTTIDLIDEPFKRKPEWLKVRLPHGESYEHVRGEVRRLALNACTALDYDTLITPCGTPQFGITSISAQLGREVSWAEARDLLLETLAGGFGVELQRTALAPLEPLPSFAPATPDGARAASAGPANLVEQPA